MKNLFMLKRLAVFTLGLFLFTFGASLLVTVNTVEATDNIVHWFPYTRYYTCGTPGTNSYGVVHTETGRNKNSYYISNDPEAVHYYEELVDFGIPFGKWWITKHVDHSITSHVFAETSEHIRLDRYHWRCR